MIRTFVTTVIVQPSFALLATAEPPSMPPWSFGSNSEECRVICGEIEAEQRKRKNGKKRNGKDVNG